MWGKCACSPYYLRKWFISIPQPLTQAVAAAAAADAVISADAAAEAVITALS